MNLMTRSIPFIRKVRFDHGHFLSEILSEVTWGNFAKGVTLNSNGYNFAIVPAISLYSGAQHADSIVNHPPGPSAAAQHANSIVNHPPGL